MVIVQGDQRMLRIMDYHPRRIFRNWVTRGTQDTHLRLGTADSHKGPGPPGTFALQEATDETIPYAFKDIPLPSGLQLENIKCVLGEDVVAVFEVGIPSLSMVRYRGYLLRPSIPLIVLLLDFGQRIEKLENVFYHPI
jgi:hypothetical protein